MSIDTYFSLGKPDEKKEITVKPALSEIVFEEKAVYNGKEKKLYMFNVSLRRLRERGYERHPRPAEAFDLICRGLEGRLQPEQQAVVDDMRNNYGEWLSTAMMREGNLLHCYLYPENLVYDHNKLSYVVQGGKLKHAGEEVYSIGSMEGCVWIKDVNKMNPALVEKLWSRHYAILPEEIRQNAGLLLPSENVLRPMGLGFYKDGYDVCVNFLYGASHGVAQQK